MALCGGGSWWKETASGILLKRILDAAHPLLPCGCEVSCFAQSLPWHSVYCDARLTPKGNNVDHGLNVTSGTASLKRPRLLLSARPLGFSHSDRKLANTETREMRNRHTAQLTPSRALVSLYSFSFVV